MIKLVLQVIPSWSFGKILARQLALVMGAVLHDLPRLAPAYNGHVNGAPNSGRVHVCWIGQAQCICHFGLGRMDSEQGRTSESRGVGNSLSPYRLSVVYATAVLAARYMQRFLDSRCGLVW